MENLSQEEIDALLEEAADEAEDLEAGAAGEMASEAEAGGEIVGDAHSSERAILNFDFNRPNNNLSKGFERNVRGVSEGFAKDSSLAFSNLLRATCDFTFGGMRVSAFGEILSGWESPSCIAVCSMEPLQGMVLLHVDAPLMFSFFTKLLGGPIEEPTHVRDFTEIEMGMARKVIQRVLELFCLATDKIVRLTPLLVQIENNPNYLNAFSDGEPVLTLQYSVAMEEVAGSINFIVPIVAFEPVREEFDPREGLDVRNPADRGQEHLKARQNLGHASATVTASFRPRPIRAHELLSLQVGDVLALGHHISKPLQVEIEGKALFEGASGQLGRSRAVRILGRKKES